MKKIIIPIIILIISFLFGCNSSNPKLAKKMIEKYSDEQNYVTLIGEVVEFSDNSVVIMCEELNDYISYEDELCDYYIYFEHNIKLLIGEQIEFVTVPFHFYNGHQLPIVALKTDEGILLSFEEGRENLINWVSIHFK